MSLLLSTGAFASSLSGAVSAMVLMNPTSITNSGGTATKSADGSVEFSSIASVSLNDCFTSDFTTYLVVANQAQTNNSTIAIRLRLSGSDATGADYTNQWFVATSSTEQSARDLSDTKFFIGDGSASDRNGSITWIYNPNVAAETAVQSSAVSRRTSMRLWEMADIHSLSTAYDGLTFYADSGGVTMTGNIAVYGVRT